MARNPVCIGCGLPTGPFPRLNRLTDGRPCPRCQQRLLETLPAPFPTPFEEPAEREPEWAADADPEGLDDYLPGA